MSSRILNPTAVRNEPIAWRRMTSPTAGPTVPPPCQPRQVEEQRTEQKDEEIPQRLEEAHRRGFVEGEARGRHAAAQQLQAAVESLARAAAEILGLRAQVRREGEEDVVKLSIAIARRILHRELTVDPGALLGLVKAALEKVDARDLKRIRAHPEIAPLLTRKLDDIGLPKRVEVTGDPSLEPGAAILETSRGTLDASVDTQLSEIERGLFDLVGAGS